MTNIEKVREQIKQMTEEERLELIMLCNLENNRTNEQNAYLKLSNNHHCPHCGSNNICKNGFTGKAQQFRCNNCHKNYSIRTNTIFFHTRKSIDLWQEYIELFSQGLSLRKIVEKMDNKINLKTAFFWRHKILKVLSNINDGGNNKLGGIIEADETFFEESQKGSRKMTRKPRKRGYSSYVGDKKTKVCVLTALDRQKHSFNKPVGYGKVNKEQVAILQHRIQDNSILITDGNKSYKILKDVKLKQLKFGKPQSKVYHLSNINNFHSKLKQFISRFNGVATKYLDNYVNYFNDIRNRIDYFNQLLNLQGFYRVCDIKNRKVCFENIKF